MDPDPPASTPRKVKFPPKGPPRRTPKQVPTSNNAVAEDDCNDDKTQESLARRVNEHLTRRGPKVEKKSSVQVAFTHGVTSTAIRTFGKQRERADDGSEAAKSKESPLADFQKLGASMSTAGTEGVDGSSDDLTNAKILKKKSEYEEPWDYAHSYYPTTLPLRRPYSGDPELLDKAEFEEAVEYDENTLFSASDLGLLNQDEAPRMLFFQFPSNLPLGTQHSSTNRRQTADNMKAQEKLVTNKKEIVGSSLPSGISSASSKGKEIAGSIPRIAGISTGMQGKETCGSSINSVNVHPSDRGCRLEELPEGYMGKMLVYRSGAVKLKIGDILYDVSPGSDCTFHQSVVAINTSSRHCCELGKPNKRAVITPDIDRLVDNAIDLG